MLNTSKTSDNYIANSPSPTSQSNAASRKRASLSLSLLSQNQGANPLSSSPVQFDFVEELFAQAQEIFVTSKPEGATISTRSHLTSARRYLTEQNHQEAVWRHDECLKKNYKGIEHNLNALQSRYNCFTNNQLHAFCMNWFYCSKDFVFHSIHFVRTHQPYKKKVSCHCRNTTIFSFCGKYR